MTKKSNTIFLICILFILSSIHKADAASLWQVQSVDTMKTSRDQTLYKQNDPSYDQNITKELTEIKKMGANFVAIDGAYDTPYIPWMNRWVTKAHALGLHVWYRGNFSGWSGWFGPKDMTRQQHEQALQSFILTNPDLFMDGDSLTPCPECEYGGPGNPLETGDIAGYRQFLIDEQQIMQSAFSAIHKHVITTWVNMNPDVAKKVVDSDTLNAMGNIITLDYYVKDIKDLQNGLTFFEHKFPHAKLLIGEFGAPLPAINGSMTESQQSEFINSIFGLLAHDPHVIGVNYWVSYFGNTALLHDDYSEKPAVSTITNYFIPETIKGTVTDTQGTPMYAVVVKADNGTTVMTTKQGVYSLILPKGTYTLSFGKDNYIQQQVSVMNTGAIQITKNITMQSSNPGLLNQLIGILKKWL